MTRITDERLAEMLGAWEADSRRAARGHGMNLHEQEIVSALTELQSLRSQPAGVRATCKDFTADPCGSSKCAACGKRRHEHRAVLEPQQEEPVASIDPDMSKGWLIHKAGRGWYRPDAQGYTNDPALAGRWSRQEAEYYSHPNGWDGPRDEITIRHESELPAQPTTQHPVASDRDALKRIYRKLAEEGGGTWATYMMIEITSAYGDLEIVPSDDDIAAALVKP